MARYSKKKVLPFLFLAPMFIMITLSWIAPLILTVYLSFTNLEWRNFQDFIKNFFTDKVIFTLKQYEKIIYAKVPYIKEVLKITLIYVSSVLLINAVYALALSLAIAYFTKNEVLSMILRITWLLPRITPGIVYALMWLWFVNPDYGMFNTLLRAIGIPGSWLPDSWLQRKPYSQLLMIMVNGYVGASFGMIVYTAAIKSIPPDLINAALVDGASEFQVARRVIIPLLKWPVLFVTAWQTLSLLSSYEYILMIWSPFNRGYGQARSAGVMVWAYYAYSNAFKTSYPRYGYAAALSMVLVVIGLVLILL